MNRSQRRQMQRQGHAAPQGRPAAATPSAELQQAIALHQAGRRDEAEGLLARLYRSHPRDAAVLQLYGLARLERGALGEAITLFERSLKAEPRQPHVHNNLGHAHHRRGDLRQAERCYRKALDLEPRYADALFNLGVVLDQQRRHEEAIACFRRALRVRPDHAATFNAMGNALRQCERLEEAADALRESLRLNPRYAEAYHNLGLVLAAMADHQAALDAYSTAQRQGLEGFQLYHNKANAHAELGEAEKAIADYRQAIARQPHYTEAHVNLNNLLWEEGQIADYLRSYEDVLRETPGAANLYAPYAVALMRQERFEEAAGVIERGMAHAPDHPDILYASAQNLEHRQEWAQARTQFERCVQLAPERVNFRVSLGRLLLEASEPDKALGCMNEAVRISPYHQLALAYQSLAWRLLGDPRDDWLNDYENFVRPYELPVPDGYDDLQSFLSELARTLDGLHTAKNNPTYNTLRHGTQTAGALFSRREPVILSLQESLRQCIADYAARLPDDPDHPLVSRRADEFGFAGSWSVRLSRSGFHTIHVHPMGWLSSAFYVRVPDVVARDEDKAGWIKFGEPDIDVGEAGRARRYVQPREGTLVLFPSYMWHGTVPFETDDTRMTVAFDVAPSPDPARPYFAS